MPVSLKHPDRPDPSEVATMALRQYTPVHLTDEIYPQNSERAYTPIHQTDEQLPAEPLRECTPIHIASEEKQIHAAAPKEPEPIEETKSGNSIVQVVLSLCFLVVLIALVVFLCTMLPQDTRTTDEAFSDVSAIVSELFSFFLSNRVFIVLLGFAVFSSALGVLRRLFERM